MALWRSADEIVAKGLSRPVPVRWLELDDQTLVTQEMRLRELPVSSAVGGLSGAGVGLMVRDEALNPENE